MAGRHARLLLGLARRVEHLEPEAREECLVDLARAGRAMDEVDEGREVLLPFARAEVNAEPLGSTVRCAGQPGVLHRHRRGGQGELRGPAMVAPALGVGAIISRAKSP